MRLVRKAICRIDEDASCMHLPACQKLPRRNKITYFPHKHALTLLTRKKKGAAGVICSCRAVSDELMRHNCVEWSVFGVLSISCVCLLMCVVVLVFFICGWKYRCFPPIDQLKFCSYCLICVAFFFHLNFHASSFNSFRALSGVCVDVLCKLFV